MKLVYKNLEQYTSHKDLTIGDYLQKINFLGSGFLVIVEKDKVVNILTDGDLRRELLNGKLLNDRIKIFNKDFISKEIFTDFLELQKSITENKIRVLPLINEYGSLAAILTTNEVRSDYKGFVLAGGEGKRLRPLTLHTPKPLLKIAGQTLLDRAVASLLSAGVNNIEISVNYLFEQFQDFHAKNYSEREIELVKEPKILGTAGSLTLSKSDECDFLVSNADLVTDFEYIRLVLSAIANDFDVVIASRKYNQEIPFGVINVDKDKVKKIDEKPIIDFNIAAGIYFINSKIIKLIPLNTYYDMPELINLCLEKNFKVGIVNLPGRWIDVGRKEQFDEANEQDG